MAEEFVSKEVYEANLLRIDQRFDSLEKRMNERFEGMQNTLKEGFALMNERMEKNLTEIKGEIRALDTRVDALGSRIDTVQTTVYWGFAIIAIVLAFLPTIQDWRKMFHQLLRWRMWKGLLAPPLPRFAWRESNSAKQDAIASEMRAQISEIKGDVKALSASFSTLQSRFAWNLAWVGIIMGLVLTVVQRLWK